MRCRGICSCSTRRRPHDVRHPSYQAWSYAALLEDFNDAVHDGGIRLERLDGKPEFVLIDDQKLVWRHALVTLSPDSDDPRFEPIETRPAPVSAARSVLSRPPSRAAHRVAGSRPGWIEAADRPGLIAVAAARGPVTDRRKPSIGPRPGTGRGQG